MQRPKAGHGAAMILVLLVAAACGGSSATPSASAGATGSPAASEAVEPSALASTEPTVAPAASPIRMLAACAGVAVRTGPSTADDALVRIGKLSKVRVVERLAGEAYDAGACGTSGSEWLKIDRINGTSVKKLYGVPFGYAAAGFFE